MDVRQQPHERSIATSTRRLPVSSQVVPSLFVVLDSLIILSSAAVLHALIVGDQPSTVGYYVVAAIFVWLTTIMLMGFAGLYQFEPIMRPLIFTDKIVISFVTTFLFLLAAAFSLKISATFSRMWIVAFAFASCAAIIGFRTLASVALRRLADFPMFRRRVAIAGAGPQIVELLEFLNRTNPAFISVLGIFVDDPKELKGGVGDVPWLGRLDDVIPHARAHTVDDIIIALPWSADEQIIDLLGALRQLAVNAYLGADLIGFRLGFRAPPSHFGGTPIFEVLDNPLAGWNGVIKLVEDYAFAIAAIIIFSPLMLIIALAIKLDTRGPVIFRQERIGFLNQLFRIYKFRTMQHEPSTGTTVQARRNDPRVTRVGRILRRLSLDELPNLINVLNGTMSLVGPRPHALDHNQAFSKTVTDYFVRHRIKPGMTGWAQVNGLRGATDTPEKIEARVQYDIYYAENWSLWFDLKILLMTLVICLTGRNAY